MKKHRFMILAGEVSGDILAADLVSRMKDFLPSAEFFGIGGDRMKEEGVRVIYHIHKLKMLGVREVISCIGKFREIQNGLIEIIKKENIDSIILVDSPAFNIPFGLKVKKYTNCPIIYYAPAQIWAWWPQRINLLKRFVDNVLVLYPFEEEIYRQKGIAASYLGCPVFDIIEKKQENRQLPDSVLKSKKNIIALLPGSRRYEVKLILPILLEAARLISTKEPDVNFVICCASSWLRSHIERVVSSFRGDSNIDILENQTYDAIKQSRLVLSASGLASLEAAILLAPVIVVYKFSLINWYFLRLSLKVNTASLANLILNKQVIPEFIQWRAKPEKIAKCAIRLLQDDETIQKMKNDFDLLNTHLRKADFSYNMERFVSETVGS